MVNEIDPKMASDADIIDCVNEGSVNEGSVNEGIT